MGADRTVDIWGRRTPHPAACFDEPVHLGKPVEEFPFTRTYVKALRDEPVGQSAFWAAAERAKADDRWRYREVDTNHLIPTNRPQELADILLELG